MATKPNVLVFGGLDVVTPTLALQLIPPLPAEPLVSHLRLVDRFIVKPPTTRLSKDFLALLRDRSDLIEYRQANLTVPAAVQKSFDDPAPNGRPYTHIIDITGELIPGRPQEIYIQKTFNTPLLIAKTSAAQMVRIPGSIKAHIRLAPPYYEHGNTEKRYKETDPEAWVVNEVRGAWWHEMLRAVGSIEGLPLVVARCGLLYGEGFFRYETGAIIPLVLVYKHLGLDLKLLWTPKLPKTSVKNYDFAGAAWRAAEWISGMSRKEADALAGAPLPPSNYDTVASANVPGVIPASAGSVIVPAFNVVDESNSTQASLCEVVARVFGVKVGFAESSGGLFDGKTLQEVTQEATEVHLGAWNELIMNSNPPVPDTPLTPYMSPGLMEEHGCAMDGERLRTILKYKCKYPHFNEQSVHEYINWCRSEGIWPETDLYP